MPVLHSVSLGVTLEAKQTAVASVSLRPCENDSFGLLPSGPGDKARDEACLVSVQNSPRPPLPTLVLPMQKAHANQCPY